MKIKFTLALTFVTTAALALAGSPLQAQTSIWKIDPAHSEINFQVRHLAVSTVRGSLNGLKGTLTLDEKDITKSLVETTIDANTVATGVDARDKHLKSPDFFDVAKYPALTFKSTSITRVGAKLKLTGDLTLGPTTKSITLDLDGPSPPQTDAKGTIRSGFSASGVLNRKEFDFGQKTAASAAISDEVKFTIDIEIDKQ